MKIISVQTLPENPSHVAVPLAEISASCGFPSPASDYQTTEIDLNQHLLPNRLSSYLMRTSGDSMEQVGIWDGDEIIVDCSLTPRPGDVVVVTIDGEMLVKRFQVINGQMVLVAENPKYPPIFIPEHADMRMWGVVTYGIRHVAGK